ncbi:NADH-quinone oxidoreductase subunit C [Candidatus Micrarchaeota archaeon]|nr:NADH-quinone oxidoreductase subunit C [Candidatus Micrarchaeota archaeon]MBU1681569.1 NADH-quinone oxidoreductase subunit C [Candidatus Micrarchaeota archaeon]
MKKILQEIKKTKSDRLVSISYVNEDEGVSIYYHFADKTPKFKEIKIEIGNEKEVESITPIHPNAAILEGEITEMYGIKFPGNPYSGKRIFLEEK